MIKNTVPKHLGLLLAAACALFVISYKHETKAENDHKLKQEISQSNTNGGIERTFTHDACLIKSYKDYKGISIVIIDVSLSPQANNMKVWDVSKEEDLQEKNKELTHLAIKILSQSLGQDKSYPVKIIAQGSVEEKELFDDSERALISQNILPTRPEILYVKTSFLISETADKVVINNQQKRYASLTSTICFAESNRIFPISKSMSAFLKREIHLYFSNEGGLNGIGKANYAHSQ